MPGLLGRLVKLTRRIITNRARIICYFFLEAAFIIIEPAHSHKAIEHSQAFKSMDCSLEIGWLMAWVQNLFVTELVPKMNYFEKDTLEHQTDLHKFENLLLRDLKNTLASYQQMSTKRLSILLAQVHPNFCRAFKRFHRFVPK